MKIYPYDEDNNLLPIYEPCTKYKFYPLANHYTV